jgi:hypothetical protein
MSLNRDRTLRELQQILESKSQLKVIFDCRGLKDNLLTNFNINLNSVFDLMLTASQAFPGDLRVRDLSICVQKVLGSNCKVESEIGFCERPLPRDYILKIAQQTGFHLALYHQLTHKILVESFQEQHDDFFKTFPSLESFITCLTSQSDKENSENSN